MDLELTKKIFILCGKESNCWLTSKFFHWKNFDFHLLHRDFPNYKSMIRNILFRKKDNNPKFIHELLSYRPKNSRCSIQNRYLDLIIENYVIIDGITVYTKDNDITKIPKTQNLEEFLNLLDKHNINISKLSVNYNANLPIGIVKSIISHPALENLKLVDFFSDILPFNHKTIEIFKFAADRYLSDFKGKYDLPNLKKVKLKCNCTEVGENLTCQCEVDIMNIFPNSLKLENIDSPGLVLKTFQPNLKKITISYLTIIKSDFFGTEIKHLKIIDDFPESLSCEGFIELCKRSNLIIDHVENLTILSARNNFMRYVDQRKIYHKIKIDRSSVSVRHIFQLADFTHYFVIGPRNNIDLDDNNVHRLSKPNLLKKFKCRGRGYSELMLDHLLELTDLESMDIFYSINETFQQKLCSIKNLKKISFGTCDVPIDQATKILQLGNFHKITFKISKKHVLNEEIIEEFCSALAENKLKYIRFIVYIDCLEFLNMIKFLMSTIYDKKLIFRMINFFIYYDENIEDRIIRKALYTKEKLYAHSYYFRPQKKQFFD